MQPAPLCTAECPVLFSKACLPARRPSGRVVLAVWLTVAAAVGAGSADASLVRGFRPGGRSAFGPTARDYSALNLVGLDGPLEHDSEFLFGRTGNSAVLTLQLADSSVAVLTTLLDPVNAFSLGNQGWWSPTEFNVDSNTNYFVGDLSDDNTRLHNNFFSFSLQSLGLSPVVAATLTFTRGEAESGTGRLTQQYTLFDVSTDVATLNHNDGVSQAIFDDLGSGVRYGSFAVPVAGDPLASLSLTLNGNAVQAINAARSGGAAYFSLGGSLATVPEPLSGVVWTALAAAAIACGSRRK